MRVMALSLRHVLICLPSGPKANTSERKAAMSAGQQFIKDKGYSIKTQVTLESVVRESMKNVELNTS